MDPLGEIPRQQRGVHVQKSHLPPQRDLIADDSRNRRVESGLLRFQCRAIRPQREIGEDDFGERTLRRHIRNQIGQTRLGGCHVEIL